MFVESRNQAPKQRRLALSASLAVHALLLGWMLHAPGPSFVTATSMMAGDYGKSTTLLYWPGSGTSDQQNLVRPKHSTATHPKASRHALILAKAAKPNPESLQPLSQIGREDETDASEQSSAPPAARAGSPYGSLSDGSLSGDEVRPALPIRPFDPAIGHTEVASVHEGDVVIEITIDEKGNVIRTVVLQSLSPDIDAKVVAALENWHFHPATRDGVAILSRQDVHYHFRDR